MFTTLATSCFPENQPAQHLPLAWHFVAEVERICTETLDLHLKEHQFNEVWGSRDSEESGLVFHIMSTMLKHETMGPCQPNKIKISMFDCPTDVLEMCLSWFIQNWLEHACLTCHVVWSFIAYVSNVVINSKIWLLTGKSYNHEST